MDVRSLYICILLVLKAGIVLAQETSENNVNHHNKSETNQSNTSPNDSEPAKTQAQRTAEAVKLELGKFSGLNGPRLDLYNEWINYLNSVINQKNTDALAVWQAARKIARALDKLEEPNYYNKLSDDNITKLKQFVSDVRLNVKILRDLSYTDQIHKNDNLSDQIQTRLVGLVGDIAKIILDDNVNNYSFRNDFKDELELFTKRYKETNRFSGGIGLSYSEIPVITYNFSTTVDLSPYQSTPDDGNASFGGKTVFKNQGILSLALVAQLQRVNIRLEFPDDLDSAINTSPVNLDLIPSIVEPVLHRETTKSTLSINYILSINFSLFNLENDGIEIHKRSGDIGAGFGLIGFNIDNEIKSDIRFQSDPTLSFNQLTTTEVITHKSSDSFTGSFVSLYSQFNLNDQLSVGLSGRYYFENKEKNNRMKIDGYFLSLQLTWYPTF